MLYLTVFALERMLLSPAQPIWKTDAKDKTSVDQAAQPHTHQRMAHALGAANGLQALHQVFVGGHAAINHAAQTAVFGAYSFSQGALLRMLQGHAA